MTIATGTKLGRYEIRSQLGAGGMGEVYQARDPKINRDVAIKVLPSAVSSDSERLRRFEQEVQATGKLNHPNILAVYDVETHDGAPYVVYELLEGETLRERLRGGAISTRKAVDYALQIANGLAAAHAKGIVHRDLKPDNIFITNDGHLKILDFGLAKLIEPISNVNDQTDVLTRKVNTDPGAVMGTAGYMSPEQVRGRAVDHRTDVFSFGAVFYEMLSGRRAFHGESAVETLNAILKEDPADLTTTNPNVAPALERVVSHCLEKSADRRFQSATDIAFALESLSNATSHSSLQSVTQMSPGPARNRERMIWIAVCALLFLTASAFAFARFAQSTPTSATVRLALATPENATLPSRVTISPDGTRVVFIATNASGKSFLWLRPLNSTEAKQLDGTEGAFSPFWSPDSRFIGFFADNKLLKIEASGGQSQTLCDAPENRGGAWGPDGTILLAGLEGLYRVSAQGGTRTLVTEVAPKEEAHRWPYFLPDGRHFIFLGDAERKEDHSIRVGSLDSKETKILFSGISRVAYAAPGYLLYVHQQALVAQLFDASALKITGDPQALVENIVDVGMNHEFDFSVSDTGVLAYQTGDPNSQLTWFDRDGKKLGTVGEPRNYGMIVLSPDSQRIATSLLDADGRIADIWLVDLKRADNITRLTFESSAEGDPVWAPDGSKIVFSSNRSGNGQVNLYQKPSGGAGDDHLLFGSNTVKYPTAWSLDGKSLLFENWDKSRGSIWVLSLSDNQAKPLLQSDAYDQFQGQISPDGRYVAYMSNESGRLEVYVQPLARTGEKWRISSNGGAMAQWRRDGKELYYVTNDRRLMSVDVNPSSPKFESSAPRQLFQANIKESNLSYGVTPDGQRFLVNAYAQTNNPAPMTIVLNWATDLKK
jgi:serine/threonine protein kinase